MKPSFPTPVDILLLLPSIEMVNPCFALVKQVKVIKASDDSRDCSLNHLTSYFLILTKL